jgi:hypothetical protein
METGNRPEWSGVTSAGVLRVPAGGERISHRHRDEAKPNGHPVPHLPFPEDFPS